MAASLFQKIDSGEIRRFLQPYQPVSSLRGKGACPVRLLQQQLVLEHFVGIYFSPIVGHIMLCIPVFSLQLSHRILRFVQRLFQNGIYPGQMRDFLRKRYFILLHPPSPFCAAQTAVWDSRIPPAVPLRQSPGL